MTEQIDIRLPRLMDAAQRELGRMRPLKLSYRLEMVPLSTATITLPADGSEVIPVVGQFVEVYDTQGSIGVFRVVNVATSYTQGAVTTIQLEHALVTIADGVVFGYKEYGGVGVNLRSVIVSLLALQPAQHWVLGACEFDTYYQYSFENENLLTALLSVVKPLDSEYLWTFDMSAHPYTLNLIKAPTQDASEMRMGRNIDSLKVDIDRTDLCTRLYPLGYGEGVNQLTIADVNSGKKYLDASTIGTWGVVSSVHTETSITEPATLKAAATTVLEKLKNPRITVTANGDDFSALTGEPMDRFYPGRMCRVPLPDYGIQMDERVISIAKSDVFGNNTKVSVMLANKGADVLDQLSRVSRKTAIGELYSQGATNQYAVHYADNADAANPMSMRFYIDAGAVHVNNLTCKYDIEAFRSYSKGAASGGGATTVAGGGSTTRAGGAAAATTEEMALNSAGQYTYPGSVDKEEHAYTEWASDPNSHRHKYEHQHFYTAMIKIPALNVKVPSHTHETPDHTHDTPDHTHADNPGIYRGNTASSVTILVDGSAVPASAIVSREFDAVPYLAKDAAGKITRGAWHTITITPNALTRIVADLHIKTFIRSISGGNY